MPFALPQLDILVAGVLALGFCLLVVVVTKAFFGVTGTLLGKLPVIGGWIDSTAHSIEQRITHTFGGYIVAIEGIIGAAWHSTARLFDHLGREIASHANLLALIADLLSGKVGVHDFVTFWHDLQRLIHGASRQVQATIHRVEALAHRLEHGIGADVLPRIRSLDRRLDHVIDHDIAGLRSRARVLEREYEHLNKWIRSHPWTVVTGAFVGAVAVALSRLGLDWIRCPTAKNVFNKRGCNMWSDLDGLLTAALAVAATMSLVDLAKAEQEVVGDISTVVRRFWQV